MAVVVAGVVAPMAPGDEGKTFRGRVWLDDDGSVEAVTRAKAKGPAGFAGAPVVDVGDAVVHPGFVDLHSHIAYNPLPLWAEPTQKTPYPHHDSWPGEQSYRPRIGWPAWTLLNRAPESVLAYVQVRALVGGTTAIQGWPGVSRRPANQLVRSVDDDQLGPLPDPVVVSALTQEVDALTKRAARLHSGRSFVYHCGEGQPGSIVEREFDDLATAGCLQQGLIAIHCCALDRSHFERWRAAADPGPGEAAGTVVWSPFSNLWLYGKTSAVPDALAAGLRVTLGTDWGPSGTKNLLGEVKVARIWSDKQGWGLTDLDLVRMITSAPGDAIGRPWQQPAGRLVPGAVGDVTVLTRRHEDVWRNLVTARERDVALVTVGSRPRFGTKPFMVGAGEAGTTSLRIGGQSRRLTLVRPDDLTEGWSWSDVLARLDKVRAEAAEIPPSGPSAGRGRAAALKGSADPPGTPPIVVDLDMPGGPSESAGPPPPGQTVDIAPIEPLHHDTRWLASLKGRGFHGGALDGLRAYYR
jgi:5-methylthioadenosine/S-adenosylhomocysteine deaminase